MTHRDRALPFESAGQYTVLGELGRGGIGVVLKGRDGQLDRDVALKVIRERHLGNREVIERFVEEAQIGGQLQHPGIVPVYELGIEGERRPYFAMKLVEGETLEDVLASRADALDGRRQLLTVLLHVCQTVAYAHSRGVVHRDLKPSNVMVGKYGEVQVLDWGLAKVLRRERGSTSVLTDDVEEPVATARSGSGVSTSRVGEVMGTFGYMPPEQARGRVTEVDERSDVFALGAILTEVLTGQAPYAGERGEVIDRARRGLTEAALERLDSSDADDTLVALAKECLSVEPRDRPRHAGALADVLARHLAAVKERARRAELDAIERRAEADRESSRAEDARLAAEEQRRRRRQIVVMVSGIAVALILGGIGWLWLWQGRVDRSRLAVAAVEEVLRDAGRLAGAGDLAAAVTAAERAAELASRGSVPPSTLTRAELQLAMLTVQERSERDLAELTAALTTVLTRPEGGDALATLREHGFDRARIGAVESVPDIVVIALDEAGRHDLARVADPDETRGRIRGADLDELRSIAAEADPSGLPARTMHLLALRLSAAGDDETAVALLRRAHLHHAGDLWINVRLADCLSRVEGGEEEASRYRAAATTLMR